MATDHYACAHEAVYSSNGTGPLREWQSGACQHCGAYALYRGGRWTFNDPPPAVLRLAAQVAALTAERDALKTENDRLAKLVEPKDWKGWDQVDSIYEEARRLRLERDTLLEAIDAWWLDSRDQHLKTALYRTAERIRKATGYTGGQAPQSCPCGRPGESPCWRVGGEAGCATVIDPGLASEQTGGQEAAWNTCPLHGHYIARARPDAELVDCPACTAAERTGGLDDG